MHLYRPNWAFWDHRAKFEQCLTRHRGCTTVDPVEHEDRSVARAQLRDDLDDVLLCQHAPASAPVLQSVRRPGSPLTERAVNFIVKEAAERAGVNPAASIHWLRHAHASHAIDNGAPITLVSATLGHADLKTTSVYAHARPGESSGRYLKTKF
jgi:integrase